MKYRVAAIFLGAWFLVAPVSVLTAGGGHPPAGPVLWVVANYFALGGRIAREIYGPVVTDLLFSRLGFVLSLIEVAVVGLGIGLVLEARAHGDLSEPWGPRSCWSTSWPTSWWRRSARAGRPSRTGCDPRGSRCTSRPSLASARAKTPRTSTFSSD
jgi:hypothetical protein